MKVNDSLLIETECGLVKGVKEGPVSAFYGLRYAEPPVGPGKRLRPPQPLMRWTGIYAADSYGPAAMQPQPLPFHSSRSEDCLTLNVWTSGTEAPSRPVLFFIHGGAFTHGTGSDPFFNGRGFAENGDIVVVTVNYRLGALGFLDLYAALGEEYRSSGNCGILDLIEALRWVRANIGRFGGDPDRVTIMGQSAGAKCVGGLLSSQMADGLFHQAIAQSGSIQSVRDQKTSGDIAAHFLDTLGLRPQDARQLLDMPANELIMAQHAWWKDLRGTHLFGPVIDGKVICASPFGDIHRKSRRMPALLIGTNLHETAGFIRDIPIMNEPSDEMLHSMFGGNAPVVRAAYEKKSGRTINDQPDHRAWESTLTDYMYRIAAIRTANAYSAAEAPVWLYRYDLEGAAHGEELAYVWHNQFAPQYKAVADLMHQTWISFIQSGSPQAAAPDWQPYGNGRQFAMVFNRESAVHDLQDLQKDDDPDFPNQAFVFHPNQR